MPTSLADDGITQDVGSRGFVETLNAPDQMQKQEGMKGKPVQVSKTPCTGNHVKSSDNVMNLLAREMHKLNYLLINLF